jgi:hypothetical protein
VNRRVLLLSICLALSAAFAAWVWLRPYDWTGDPGARYRVVHASLERDHSHYWLGLKLKQTAAESHDLTKPVHLLLADGRELEPAETQLEGRDGQPVEVLGFRFWLTGEDLAGPLRLRLNDGTLTVRQKPGLPAPGGESIRYFLHSNW